jgi:hypothetical protein
VNVIWAALRAFIAACAAVAVILQQANTPSEDFWTDNRWLFYLAVAVIGLGSFIPAIVTAARAGRIDKNARRTRSIETVLGGTLLTVHNASRIPVGQLGIEAYFIGNDHLLRHPLKRKALVRHGQVRLGAQKSLGGIRWTEGKGALGACWKTGKLVRADYDALASGWEAASKVDRLDLTHDESKLLEGFGVVVVHPIFDDGDIVRGCISADAPSVDREALDAEAIKDALANTEKSVWIAAQSSLGTIRL